MISEELSQAYARTGAKPWGPIDEIYEIGRAEAILGFRPKWGFEQYLEALRSGRDRLV